MTSAVPSASRSARYSLPAASSAHSGGSVGATVAAPLPPAVPVLEARGVGFDPPHAAAMITIASARFIERNGITGSAARPRGRCRSSHEHELAAGRVRVDRRLALEGLRPVLDFVEE